MNGENLSADEGISSVGEKILSADGGNSFANGEILSDDEENLSA